MTTRSFKNTIYIDVDPGADYFAPTINPMVVAYVKQITGKDIDAEKVAGVGPKGVMFQWSGEVIPWPTEEHWNIVKTILQPSLDDRSWRTLGTPKTLFPVEFTANRGGIVYGTPKSSFDEAMMKALSSKSLNQYSYKNVVDMKALFGVE